MTDTNDFFEWLDDQEDPTEREAGGWICDTIDKAEGAARRLREATDRMAAIDAVADRMIADANAWREQASAPWSSQAQSQSRDLETFLRIQIEQGGPKSAPLPYGVSVAARKTGGALVFDDGFADTAPDEVVRIKRAIDAKAAKEFYTVTDDGAVVDPCGEIVDGVTVSPVVDSVRVTS